MWEDTLHYADTLINYNQKLTQDKCKWFENYTVPMAKRQVTE